MNPQSLALLVKADAARNSVELRTSSAVSVDIASNQQPTRMGIVANGKRSDGRRSRSAPPDIIPSRVGGNGLAPLGFFRC